MNVNSVCSESFSERKECPRAESLSTKKKGEIKEENNKEQTSEIPGCHSKWTQNVLEDVKLLWNISVHVDIPVFEDYQRMCLFNNHWSTTMEDLELLRRNLRRRGQHPDTGFLTFGGHWSPKQNACEKKDCFFGDGHKYEL